MCVAVILSTSARIRGEILGVEAWTMYMSYGNVNSVASEANKSRTGNFSKCLNTSEFSVFYCAFRAYSIQMPLKHK
jgi:hypothetical protein